MADVINKYLDRTGLEALIKEIKSGDAAALNAAKAYCDSLSGNYEEAGAVATAKRALEEAIAAVESKADANTAAIAAEKFRAEGVEAGLDTAVKAAKSAADAAQADVDALETYVGTIPEGATATDVIGYVQEKTSGIATESAMTELGNRVTQAEKDIDVIEADYLKAADKTELQGKIDTVSAAVTAEVDRAKGVESGIDTRLKAVEDDYLKAADKAELKGTIDANKAILDAVKEDVDTFFADADFTENAKDTLKEIQAYIDSDVTAAASMTASIKQNADDIDAVEGRVGTLETEMDAVEKKASDNASAISALQTAVGEGGSVDEKITAAVAAETTAREEAVAAVKAIADKGVSDAATAQAAADKAQGEVDALEEVVATKASSADLTALGTKVYTAEGEIDALQADMEQAKKDIDAVESQAATNKTDIATNATAIAKKAEQTTLDAEVARAIAAEQANADAIAAFVPFTAEEVTSMFTTTTA